MKIVIKTRKPRNPFSIPAAARKAGEHRVSERKRERQEKFARLYEA